MKILRTRWATLAASIIVEAGSGMFYAFSLYSPNLKYKYELSETQLNLISTMGKCALL